MRLVEVLIWVVIIFLVGTFFSVLILTMSPSEDTVLIDGDDVVSYNIINKDEIEIVTEDNIYIIDLRFSDDVVDFTVNSDIHIELERFDTRVFWRDLIIHSDPVYPDEYSIGRIIKTPSEDR